MRPCTALVSEPLERRELLTAVTPVYTIENRWNTGFQADLQLRNGDTANVASWSLEFDLAADITSIWNAKIAGRTGNHYTITGESWNKTLLGGSSVDFGFIGKGAASTPTNYRLNGSPVGDTTPPPPALPSLAIGDATVSEGASSTTSAVFTATLSSVAADAVLVNFATTAGTATSGTDFRAASGTLTFAPGERSKTVTVAVLGDTVVEDDESFFVDLSNVRGATLARARAAGTITNDDLPAAPTGSNAQFQVTSDWGSGFTALVTLKNSGSTPLANWQFEFDFAATITAIWDAKVVTRTGNHYMIQNAGYNSTIAAGGTMTFGFNGSPGNVVAGPANYLLKPAGTGGTTPPANLAPVAADDLAYTSTGQAVVVAVLANDADPNGDALTVSGIGTAAHGTVTLLADNTIRYTPQAGYTGADSFTYTLRDTAGATATGRVNVNVSSPTVGAWPAHVFAPYVDVTLWPTYDMVAAARTQGLRYFTLAFITASSAKKPAWGGYTEYELGTAFDSQMKAQIAGVRGLGGDVIVSFGGAANQELALVITDVAALRNAYQSVIDAHGLTHIDFDIEGAASADRASVDRRNQAIAQLQQAAAAAGKTLDVSYTLPVLPSGLTADGVYILQSALRYGVVLGNVNIMAMDYGDSAAPNPQGKMGDYAIAAATSLFNQLKTLYGTSKTDAQLWNLVGVTPMIGLNDITTEVFDQQEARELLAFAQQMGIGRIAFWSLNRDQQNSAGRINYVDNFSSSIVQSPYEFSLLFKPFTG